MSTNYYLKQTPCEHCGRVSEPLHIGKSSADWCFSLHVFDEWDDEPNPKSLEEWCVLWNSGEWEIWNEYDETVSPSEMLKIITERKRDKPVSADFDWSRNYATPGPNNLIRHRLGDHCSAHGDGTYDLIKGEFS